VFYNPTLQKFSTSADYLLDSNKSIGSAFPSLHYDGGLHIRLYSNPKEDTLEPYPIGSPVFAQLSTTADGDEMIAPGTVVWIPSDSDGEIFYRIRLDENQTLIPCDRSQLRSLDEPILSGSEDHASYAPESPEWCRVGIKVTLLVGTKYYNKGALDLDEDQDWIFVVRNRNGKVVMEYTLVDLPYTWNILLVEGTLVVGHHARTLKNASSEMPFTSRPNGFNLSLHHQHSRRHWPQVILTPPFGTSPITKSTTA
jgi:hypothetical protein